MNLPPVPNNYDSSIQTVLQDELRKANDQNLKLDKDNFFKSGTICLQSSNGKWWKLTVNDSGNLVTTELTGTMIDSEGRPNIASTNPYS